MNWLEYIHMMPKSLTLVLQLLSMLLPSIIAFLNKENGSILAGLNTSQQQATQSIVTNLQTELAHHNPVAPPVPPLVFPAPVPAQ
jgi:hypothetical protein